jgi:hypothetical protein
MFRALLTGALALLFLSATASATVVIATEFREVVSDATLIFRGHITDVRAIVVPNQGIETVATVAVDEALKGRASEFVSIRVPGGAVGRYRWVMVGAPSLHAGEEALFFLKRDGNNVWRPVGLAMGIYRVQAEAVTGRAVVDPPLAAGMTASTGTVVRGDARRHVMAVSEFESLVRVVMAGQSGAAQRGGR